MHPGRGLCGAGQARIWGHTGLSLNAGVHVATHLPVTVLLGQSCNCPRAWFVLL